MLALVVSTYVNPWTLLYDVSSVVYIFLVSSTEPQLGDGALSGCRGLPQCFRDQGQGESVCLSVWGVGGCVCGWTGACVCGGEKANALSM